MRAQTIVLTFITLLLTLPVSAQTCLETDTPRTCWQKFNPPFSAAARSTQVVGATNAVGDAVATTNTGKPDLGTIGNTALRDFLSVFTAALQTATVGQKNGAITLDYNLHLDLLHENDVIKLQGTFAKPQLDAGLKTALGTNGTAISKLSDSFDEADDIMASATYSPSTPRFGRSLANHRILIEALMNAVVVERRDDDPARLVAVFGDVLKGSPEVQSDTPFTVITDATKRANAVAGMEAAARAQQQLSKATAPLIAKFAELLNNQEQVYGSALYHHRSSLAGANGWSFKGTYELGGRNITKFLKQNAAECDVTAMSRERDTETAGTSLACLQKFRQYVPNDAKADSSQWRFAASVEIQRTESNTINLPQYTVALKTPQSDTRSASITAGRRLDAPTSSRERRIDFTANYDDVTNDPTKNNRLIASLTYTQEITNSFTLPITLAYANKPQYLADVNKRLNVHFGISYKLPRLAP